MGSMAESPSREPIAIVGMATRFPQDADTVESLWSFLLKARQGMTGFPEDRISSEAHYHPDAEHGGTFHVKGAHFLSEDPALFDAPFFKVTKSELWTLDPQQRLIMENTYHALENAGIPISEVTGTRTGVYTSGFNVDHAALLNMDPETTLKYKPQGTSNSIIAGRVSWFYDLKGPSMTLDTACSSSMVALHLACQSLQLRETNMGIVAGANYLANPIDIMGMAHHGFLSGDGKCYSFDHRANGYSRGEGVGSIVVKRLADAIRDGNTIRAVIRGTGVNQDGRTAGITLPSATAQEILIKEVYASAGLTLAETRMLEAHGTGTAAGDPIEANAAARVFGPHRSRQDPLIVGAVKSGIGHLEGGAGVAGIIKSVLVVESGIIPPNVNFEKANPKIPTARWNLKFPTENLPWPTDGVRRISINSFGVGGTNGHCILDDAHSYQEAIGFRGMNHNTRVGVPTADEVTERLNLLLRLNKKEDEEQVQRTTEEEPQTNGQDTIGHKPELNGVNETNETKGVVNGEGTHTSKPGSIFTFSAFDEDGIKRNAAQLSEYLSRRKICHPDSWQDDQYLSDLAFTLSSRRSIFPWRSFCVADSQESLVQKLNNASALPISRVQNKPRIGLVFTGQGAQWFAMGRELLAFPIYRRSVEEASIFMMGLGSEWNLLDEMTSTTEDKSKINSPSLSHPCCVALQIAVVDLLDSWGVTPAAVVGHSSGEIAAAYAAGRLSRQSAFKAAYWRGKVSAQSLTAKGAMTAVALQPSQLYPYMAKVMESSGGGELTIACFNSPKNCTVSGDEEKVDKLKTLLDEQQIFARKLNVKNAYHSAHMREVAESYRAGMGDLTSGQTPERAHLGIKLFSTVTGQEVTEDQLGPDYWVENMVSPVRFADAIVAMGYHEFEEKRSLQLNSGAEFSVGTVIEIGPHGAMKTAVNETLSAQVGGNAVTYMRVLDRSIPGSDVILSTVGALFCQGDAFNIEAVNRATSGGNSKLGPKMLVDLPPYKFNHSERTIMESRLSKAFRLRKHKRHDLFGAPVAPWDAESHRWRQIVRLSELPWLRDHVVTESYVYPGVGYIIMALEAVRQVALDNASTSKITGYRFQDISIHRALIIPDDKEGAEVSLGISRWDEATQWTSSIWSRFVVSSFDPTSNEWIEHCTGYVSVEYEAKLNPIDNGREAQWEAGQWKEKLQSLYEANNVPFDVDSVYDNLVTTGLKFGPLFRNLSSVRGSSGKSGEISTTITIPDVAGVMPKNYQHEHVIHPSTMDSMFHHFLLSVLDLTGKSTLDSAMVPVYVKKAWISANIKSEAGKTFRGYGSSHLVAYEKYESDIMVWDGEKDEGLVSIEGLRATPLESSTMTGGAQRRDLCHTIEWTPAEEFLTPESFSHVERSSPEQDDEYRYRINRLQLAVMLNITDALRNIPSSFDPTKLQGHMRKYWDWLHFQRENLEQDQIVHLKRSQWEEFKDDAAAKQRLYEEVAQHNGDGALATRMGANIVDFLTREEGGVDQKGDPLGLMFADALLDQVYDEAAGLGDIPRLFKAYLRKLYHTSSNIRILEIGAGTGASTAIILDHLSDIVRSGDETEVTATRVVQYTFTDISAGFFEKAKERFRSWADVIEFKTYNAELDPADQELATSHYDFVVAGNVVHTTKSLKTTLSNMQKLLKPGGKLLMQEGVRQNFLWSPLAFGQLPGWWQGTEPTRKWSPWIPVSEWDSHLKSAGFDGITMQFPDRIAEDLHTQSLFVATALGERQTNPAAKRDLILLTTDFENPSPLAMALQGKLPDSRLVRYTDLTKEENLREATVVSVLEFEQPLLAHLTEDQYLNIRHLLSTVDGLLWVTGDMAEQPECGMISGMIRSIRWERDIDGANLIPLSISQESRSSDSVHGLVSHILSVFSYQFNGHQKPVNVNAEYLLRDGELLTNRLVEAPVANDYLNSKFIKPAPQMIPLREAGRPLKLSTSAPGMLNKLEFVTDTIYYEPLDTDLVEIEIKAVGLNFRDVMIAMGEHLAYSLGNEAAGVVTRVGDDVPDLEPGDRVVYMCGFESVGCFHTYGRVQWQNVVKIPDSLSYEVAAGLPCVYSTVLYGLYDIARLSEGETILVHAAAGGIGQAAIQLARNVGAEVFATVSSPEKRDLLTKEYGVPEDHIFSSRDLTFVKGIKRMTSGKGVDVLLNSLSGDLLHASWDIIAPFGRFIEIGKKDSQGGGRVPLQPFLRQAMMASVELPMMMRYKPLLFRRLISDTVRLYLEGKIHEARPTAVMSYEKVEEALRMLQSGRGMGKIILVPSPTDIVPVAPEPPAEFFMNPDATYVVAGGLGGIGRSIGKWMASKGARHIAFLSRTGKVTESVKQMIDSLKSRDCEAHLFACDISDGQAVKGMVAEVQSQGLPPIKGVVQGAMVLKDCMFENMSFADFQTAVLPKVQGSWNLHEHLPREMDFFVMLSSATGILGNRSQANYAAGNNYQDWLARTRLSQGLPATSIDLGTVLSVGYVAEHRENMTTLANVLEVIREDEIHILLEHVIDPRGTPMALSNAGGNLDEYNAQAARSQLIVGLTTTEYLRQRGVPPLTYLSYPLFTHLNTQQSSRVRGSKEDAAHLAVLALPHATTKEEAVEIICDGIRHKLASLLAIPVDNVDPKKSVSSNGVDSLVAMEFRAWVVKGLKADIPLLDIMGTGSLIAISEKVVKISPLVYAKK